MKPLLITTTLLDNYAWFVNSPDSWKKRAYEGFVSTLTRAPFKPTPQIQRGISFERKINNLIHGTKENFLTQLGNQCGLFYDICKGGEQQRKIKRTLRVGDFDYLLYGKVDYWFPEINIDAKTTANYSSGRKKYLDKTQHLMYSFIEEKPDFTYIVAVFNDPEEGPLAEKPDYVDVIDVSVNLLEAERIISERITDCISFIRNDPDMKKAYLEKFNWN